jgi:hypothetical protein
VALVTTGYEPRTIARGASIFEAAMIAARELMQNPRCPMTVKAALDDYDEHTRCLRI